MLVDGRQSRELKRGIYWNIFSYGIIGGFTLLIYMVIGRKYGQDALGTYSLSLTIFGLLGQIGVCGQQSSAVYFITKYGEKKDNVISSMLFISFACGLFVGILTYISAYWVGVTMFHNEYLVRYLRRMAPAISLFSVNKYLLGCLNGMKRMTKYAHLQSLRYVIIVVYSVLIVCLEQSFEMMAYSFLVSELCVSVGSFVMLKGEIILKRPEIEYVKETFRFGMKSMLGGVVAEFNTKIDVIMLGLFCTTAEVGAYSYISLIAVGVIGGLNVLRLNYNIVFAELFFRSDMAELRKLCKKIKKAVTLLMAAGSLLCVLGYYMVCRFLLGNEHMISIVPFVIVMSGLVCMSSMHVCCDLCTQSGRPSLDTIATLITMMVNIALDFLLVPRLNILGAAIATCVSYLAYAVVISGNIRRVIRTYE